MTASPTSRRLLIAARTVVDRQDALANSSSWARSAALLARQALEEALDRFWEARQLRLRDCRRRTQLLCLPWYVTDVQAARLIHQTWASLSSACHHHAYDLAPTAAELRSWFVNVESGITMLETAAAA